MSVEENSIAVSVAIIPDQKIFIGLRDDFESHMSGERLQSALKAR